MDDGIMLGRFDSSGVVGYSIVTFRVFLPIRRLLVTFALGSSEAHQPIALDHILIATMPGFRLALCSVTHL